MRNQKKSYLAFITGLLIVHLAQAQTPGSETHGGFAYTFATARLHASVDALQANLNRIPESLLAHYRVERLDLVEAIAWDALDQRPQTSASRAGRPLELDYRSRPHCMIRVLEPFYVSYEARRSEPASDVDREIQRKLLHEASHCSGASEATARTFSERAIDALYPIPAPVEPVPPVPACNPAEPWSTLRSGVYSSAGPHPCQINVAVIRATCSITIAIPGSHSHTCNPNIQQTYASCQGAACFWAHYRSPDGTYMYGLEVLEVQSPDSFVMTLNARGFRLIE